MNIRERRDEDENYVGKKVKRIEIHGKRKRGIPRKNCGSYLLSHF